MNSKPVLCFFPSWLTSCYQLLLNIFLEFHCIESFADFDNGIGYLRGPLEFQQLWAMKKSTKLGHRKGVGVGDNPVKW